MFSNFLSLQTPELRNSQICEESQLWYNLNYFNLFQVFVHIFEVHTIQKTILKYMDSVASKGETKISLSYAFDLF